MTISSIFLAKPFYLLKREVELFRTYVPESIIIEIPEELVGKLITEEEKSNFLKANTQEKLNKGLERIPCPVLIPALATDRLGKGKNPVALSQLPMPDIPAKNRIGALLNAMAFKMITGTFLNVGAEMIWKAKELTRTEGLSISDGTNLPKLLELNPEANKNFWMKCVPLSTPEADRKIYLSSFMHNLTVTDMEVCNQMISDAVLKGVRDGGFEKAEKPPRPQGDGGIMEISQVPDPADIEEIPDKPKREKAAHGTSKGERRKLNDEFEEKMKKWKADSARIEEANKKLAVPKSSVTKDKTEEDPMDPLFKIEIVKSADAITKIKNAAKVLNKKSKTMKSTLGKISALVARHLSDMSIETDDINDSVMNQIIRIDDPDIQLFAMKFALMDPKIRGEIVEETVSSDEDAA